MRKLFLFIFFSTNLLSAQKIVKKTIVNNAIETIEIDAKNCFRVNLKTSNTDELIVRATIDGEYSKDLFLNVKEEDANIFVSTGFTPNFKNPNDKLSAHKVVSIALDVIIPENHKLRVYGTSCNVLATGNYKYLNVTLNDGICVLNEVAYNTMVTTQSGDIFLTAIKGEIKANSKYGIVEKNVIPIGENYFVLKTITGDIQFTKSE
ncbi:hypothetical protein GH721_12850 [Kriegella sp. EG-1]|nr:hypothetical protein [Flavobacteriaceae bacterium EG-1]